MSSFDPRNTVDTPGTNPNKGLNTRSFIIAVISALFVILLVLFIVARRSTGKVTPVHDGRPTTPQSDLLAPGTRPAFEFSAVTNIQGKLLSC